MKTKSQELNNKLAEKYEAIKAILDKEDADITPEELASTKTLKAEAEALKLEITEAEETEALALEATEGLKTLNAPATKMTHTTTVAAKAAGRTFVNSVALKSFVGEVNGKPNTQRAYEFGRFILAALGHTKSLEYCTEHGIPVVKMGDSENAFKAQSESVNISGGYLVPEEFNTDIIVLRETYGVFRRNVTVTQMARDVMTIPRRSSGLTSYYIGENATITESSMTWNQVKLTAKKLACLAKYSSELNEDGIVNIGDVLAGEIAYAFANAEDAAGFNGDGTSTYAGIVGLAQAFYSIPGGGTTVSSIAGLYAEAASGGWNSLVLADFNNTKAKLPLYAVQRGRCKWYTSLAFYSSVMERLALAAGGVTSMEILAGANGPKFLGFPVEFTQVMPVTSATSQICAYLGDLNLAAVMGDRRQTTIAFSEHLNFAEDEIAIRGTERYDINIHDVGNYTATASLQVPGPMVGLITNAS